MTQTVVLAAILLVLLLAAGWWWLRGRQPVSRRGEARRDSEALSTLPMADSGLSRPWDENDGAPASRRGGRARDDDVLYADVPLNRPTLPPRDDPYESTLSSVFERDFTPSTLPLPLADAGVPAWSGANPQGLKRIHLALQALGDSEVAKAWEAVHDFVPEAAHREAAMETFERIGLAFERAGRYDRASEVYQHMVDIDPSWRQIAARLTRAKGLVQSARVAGQDAPAAPAATPATEAPLGRLGPYLLMRQIGQGAMGAVYLGHDPATDRQVALKTMALAQEFSGDDLADARSRFLREAEMAGRLKHPDIVSIIDSGEHNGLAYIAMELVQGEDLSHYNRPNALLPLKLLLPIMARVADALAYAHSQGVTHRDIKPANIMVDLARGGVKIMDFGVARVADAARTRTGVVLGTPTFMSPEQLSGQPIDGRSDLYALGVTLFQLLTGQLPYQTDSMASLMRAIGRDPVPHVCTIRPDLPQALGDIVAVALQKRPTMRYANGHQLAEDLRAVALSLDGLDLEVG